MNGSAQSGNMRILGHTYENCVDDTGARILYVALVVENLIIYGSNVLTHSVKHQCQNRAFICTGIRLSITGEKKHKKWTPISLGCVIPVQ